MQGPLVQDGGRIQGKPITRSTQLVYRGRCIPSSKLAAAELTSLSTLGDLDIPSV